ncbi:YveK family protein [Scatolibacter rhodanostii]|uniref:YveK family protein n=1 Tax=Scatolibacter rhodanostii TaxID=2014781 RepID=UPI000C08385D|nr:Wzz/FepE/Etk N-terminal domain-containing protein [Scatolibacter rhodanostii]
MQEELSLAEILYTLQKRWKWIFISTILGGIAVFLLSSFLLPKKYTSTLELYVNNAQSSVSSGDLNINDINAAQKLVSTYVVILKNPDVMQTVADTVGSVDKKFIEDTIVMASVDNTEVLRISAETTDPDLSAQICNTMAELAPGILTRVVKAGSVEIIAPAVPSPLPSSPNVIRNTVIGAFLFFMLAVGASILLYFLDTTVKGEEDIKQRTGLSVLGEIPVITDK